MLQMHIFITSKKDVKLYKALPRCIAHALEKPFKKKLEILQKQQIII